MADSFTLLINSSSPQLYYSPFADTLSIPNFLQSWNPCFSISACPTFPGEQGNGTSYHVTSSDGAMFSIQWWGNGIQLAGFTAGSITYDLELDGVTKPNTTTESTLLASYDGLTPGNHTLSLTVHNPTNSPSAFIAIDHALITVNSTSPNVTFSNTVIGDTALPFTGQWSFLNDTTLSELDSAYHTSISAGDFVNYTFTGAAVTVFGFRDITSGAYSVKLDNDTIAFNGSSSAREAATLFFRTGLNSSVQHTLTITNADDRLLAIGSINITTAQSNALNTTSPRSSSRVSRGTIAAIAVASILGALVFLILGFFLWLRRRQFGRILHRKRSFVPPSGNDHSKVLDIVRGPEIDDFEDMYEDKNPADKSRPGTHNESGSLSFTLDLPIQSRPSLPHSHRDYSGNSAQELPRSPTISLGRTGTHARDSSRGVPLHEVPAGDVDNSEAPQPPSPVAQGQETNEGVRTSVLSQGQEVVGPTEERTFVLTPVVPAPPLPSPAQGGSDHSQPSYSFLDISVSSQTSFTSVRHPGHGASSSSSSSGSGSMRRRSDEPYSSTRRVSLPFAMGFHHDPPSLPPSLLRDRPRSSRPRPLPAALEFPRFSLNIRPLPRIPQSAVEPRTASSMLPVPPPRIARPHTQSTPPLHVHTEFDEPQQIPRSVSATTAPLTSALSSTRAPHIVIHPSSLLRARHPRTSSVISPTESVPVTVSDIHFRHSSDEEQGEPESRRGSTAVGEHPPPHPPLPQRSYTSPFIMHKLFGTPAPPQPRFAGEQLPMQTPGAGPSRLRDRDEPAEGSSSSEQEK